LNHNEPPDLKLSVYLGNSPRFGNVVANPIFNILILGISSDLTFKPIEKGVDIYMIRKLSFLHKIIAYNSRWFVKRAMKTPKRCIL
jgi:hypothetical protein